MNDDLILELLRTRSNAVDLRGLMRRVSSSPELLDAVFEEYDGVALLSRATWLERAGFEALKPEHVRKLFAAGAELGGFELSLTEALKYSPHVPEDVRREILLSGSLGPRSPYWYSAALNPCTTEDELVELCKQQNVEDGDVVAVAWNPNFSPRVAFELCSRLWDNPRALVDCAFLEPAPLKWSSALPARALFQVSEMTSFDILPSAYDHAYEVGALIEEARTRSRADAFDALLPSWVGSLDSLVEATHELG